MTRPLVALLFQSDAHGTQEAFCRAFAAAARRHDWRLHLAGSAPTGLAAARELGAAAVVGPLGREDLAQAARATGLPAINVYGGARLAGLLQVGVSDRATGALAARSVLELGHRHLAYLGFRPGPTADEGVDRHRYAAIRAVADEHGVDLRHASLGDLDEAWLRALPRPCALIGVDDRIAASVALRAERCGIRVPEDLGLLGINDQALLCELTDPPLASVQLGAERLGGIAVEMLARRLTGEPIEEPIRLLQPQGVHLRASLGISAGLPEPVRAALAAINAGGWRHGDPERIAQAVGRNRRVLDNLFREHLGGTVFARLRARLIAEVQRRLADPGVSVAAIARELGFSSPSYLGRVFRAETGVTPVAWRG